MLGDPVPALVVRLLVLLVMIVATPAALVACPAHGHLVEPPRLVRP
jgi:hypothetical protein